MNGSRSTPTRRRLRLAALIVAVIGVLALAAAAFVLSYPGARDTALTAGVTKDLARIYPGLFDAVLVIACAAALALRGALRAYAWLAILVITAAIAAADATHAMAVTLPKRPMEATVAAVPWAVLLIGFTLLYAMARQARPAKTPAPDPAPLAAPPAPGNGIPPTGKTVPLNELLKAKPGQDPTTPTEKPQAETPPAKPVTPTEKVQAETPPAKKGRGKKARAKESQAKTPATPARGDTPAATSLKTTVPEPSTTSPEPTPTATPTTAPTETTATRAEPARTEPVSATPLETPAADPAPAEMASPQTRSAETTTTAPTETGPAQPPTTTPADTAQEGSASGEPANADGSTPTQANVNGPTTADGAESPEADESGPTKADESEPAEMTPSGAPLAALPPLPRRRAIPRDEPSDADAESPEPAFHFNRLRSSPTPPGEED